VKFFIAVYHHPDEEGWKQHLEAHVAYLERLLKDGTLRASGPLVDTPVRSAMLILTTETREHALAVIEEDPFTAHGLVADLTITEWNPIFGTYRDECC
jgi:uncharacterized protein